MGVFGLIVFLICAAYILGLGDGLRGRPTPPSKGTYDSGEHEDRVEEYGDFH
jgi:hypothetical protein